MLVLLAIALVVLAVSGVWLWFRYRPTVGDAWPGTRRTPQGWIRITHRVAGHVAVLLALVALVLLVGRRIRTRGRGVVAGVGVLVTAVAASFTGYLLPWDQLALWAVTVGSNIRGVSATFDARVKYILIGSKEISPGTYRFWAVSHVVLGLLVAVAVILAWLRTRERVSRPSPPAPEAEAEPQPVG